MDPFWDFLEPLVYNNNLLTKYDDFLRTQFGLNECYKVIGRTTISISCMQYAVHIPYIVVI